MKIILGITGSIAAYKALDLTRNLAKAGHQVRVLLTEGAEKFVVPKVFSYLGAEAIYRSQSDFSHQPGQSNLPGSVLHIELRQWADLMIVAPLSANTLANFCQAKANDLLTSIFLAWNRQKPIILFPTMNSAMLDHPFTKQNLEKISFLPWCFIHPTEKGLLACGDYGPGKLPSVELIQDFIESFPLKGIQPERLLITTGATLSPLDPVRYLTNASTGKTGLLLAKEALARGYKVCMIAGQKATSQLDHLLAHPHYQLHRVVTTSDLKQVVKRELPSSNIYISSAAISDIEFKTKKDKIKKSSLSKNLPFKKSSDILSWVIQNRSPHQKIIGFAAETKMTKKTLEKKWQNKPVDLLIGTSVDNGLTGGKLQGFQVDTAQYLIRDQLSIDKRNLSKRELACEILNRLQ